jgi:DNA-binding response OmpR family regulator
MVANVSKSLRHTILVVEQEPDVSRLMRRLMSGGTAKIVAACSGARALQIALRTPVDLVMLDVQLPDISGTEVLQRLRRINASTPVIMVTSRGSAATVRAAMELGAFDYLTKPFESDEMETVVYDALASRTVPTRLRA